MTKLDEKQVKAEYHEIIEETIRVFGPPDGAVRERWRQELWSATRSGWFCPAISKELILAIESLMLGKEIPSFPRSG